MLQSWVIVLFSIITISNIQRTQSAICGSSLTASTTSYKQISSPYTHSNVYCVWTIQTLVTYHVKLEFRPNTNIRQGTNRTCVDSLRVYDGPLNTSPLLGTVCGSSLPTFVSSGKTLRLVYTTTGPSYLSRFNLRYIAGKFKGCGDLNLVATSSKKSITSPSYPSFTTSSTFCKWRIDAGAGHTVSVTLNLSNCSTAYVRVYDGFNERSRLIRGWCGSNLAQRSTQRYIFIEYSTQVNVPSRFKLQYWKYSSGSDDSTPYIKYIAGGVVGAVAFVAIVCASIFYAVKRSEHRPFSVFA